MKFVNLHTHFYTNSDSILEIVNQYPNEFSEKFRCILSEFTLGILMIMRLDE